jgi:hypothetical protein
MKGSAVTAYAGWEGERTVWYPNPNPQAAHGPSDENDGWEERQRSCGVPTLVTPPYSTYMQYQRNQNALPRSTRAVSTPGVEERRARCCEGSVCRVWRGGERRVLYLVRHRSAIAALHARTPRRLCQTAGVDRGALGGGLERRRRCARPSLPPSLPLSLLLLERRCYAVCCCTQWRRSLPRRACGKGASAYGGCAWAVPRHAAGV